MLPPLYGTAASRVYPLSYSRSLAHGSGGGGDPNKRRLHSALAKPMQHPSMLTSHSTHTPRSAGY